MSEDIYTIEGWEPEMTIHLRDQMVGEFTPEHEALMDALGFGVPASAARFKPGDRIAFTSTMIYPMRWPGTFLGWRDSATADIQLDGKDHPDYAHYESIMPEAEWELVKSTKGIT